jgi:hypothetical protein
MLGNDPGRSRQAADMTDQIDDVCGSCREKLLRARRK